MVPGEAMAVHHQGVGMVPEEVMAAHQEADMVLEEGSAADHHLLAGTAEGVVITALALALVGRHEDRRHRDTPQILTTALRAVWACRDRHLHKTNLWPEALRPAVTLLLARPSRWTSVLVAPLLRLSRLRLTA